MDQDEPFLRRWARRKSEAAAKPGASPSSPASAQPPAVPQQEDEPSAAPGEGEGPRAEPLDLSRLPRIEDLTSDSDLRPFLDVRVPEALRSAAVKRMWSLDPTIRDFIEVAEWQWDWNTPGGAPGYGPIEAGTDVARLLAQATGATWRAPEAELSTGGGAQAGTVAPDAADPETGAPVVRAGETIVADAQQAAEAPASLPSPAPGPEGSEVAVEPGSGGEATAFRARPRHGGALPS